MGGTGCVRDEAAQWLSAVVESCDDAIVSKTLDGVFLTWNQAAVRIFGYAPEEAIGKPATILIPPERQHEEVLILDSIRKGQRVETFETVRVRKDGALVHISLTVSPVRNSAGEVIGASKIARAITERKRNQERINTLAREAEHRTKNILASVQAIVRLSDASSVEDLKQTILNRFKALADVHAFLVEGERSGNELRRLVESALGVYSSPEDGRATIVGPSSLLSPEVAQVLAITLQELATNAAKYGALSDRAGRIHVEWTTAPESFTLMWKETGGPPVQQPTRRGFGTVATQRLVESYLKGNLRFDWQRDGLLCEISLPI